MARISPFDVEGFDELNKKLKRLPDTLKRKEVLAIQRKLAKPVQKAYAANLPRQSENLAKSVAIRTVPSSKSKGNPSIVVRPDKRGRYDGFYRFMVVPKGTKLGNRRRGSRKVFAKVVPMARQRTLLQKQTAANRETEIRTAKYIQRKIDRL
ncbi:MAG: HK97 gp10 family phage protein [Bacteroidota bacterium]